MSSSSHQLSVAADVAMRNAHEPSRCNVRNSLNGEEKHDFLSLTSAHASFPYTLHSCSALTACECHVKKEKMCTRMCAVFNASEKFVAKYVAEVNRIKPICA